MRLLCSVTFRQLGRQWLVGKQWTKKVEIILHVHKSLETRYDLCCCLQKTVILQNVSSDSMPRTRNKCGTCHLTLLQEESVEWKRWGTSFQFLMSHKHPWIWAAEVREGHVYVTCALSNTLRFYFRHSIFPPSDYFRTVHLEVIISHFSFIGYNSLILKIVRWIKERNILTNGQLGREML